MAHEKIFHKFYKANKYNYLVKGKANSKAT